MNKLKSKIKKINYYHLIFLISLILVSIVFLLGVPIFYPDSVEYFSYLDIFNRVSPFSTWNVVRGFSLPLIFWIFTKVFGSSALGVNIGMYLFYLFLIIFSYYIVYSKVINTERKKTIKIIYYLFYLVFILFNPILFGYCHGVLTEFVAIPLSVLSCYLAFLWFKDKFIKFNDKKNIIFVIIFSILFVFVWFLKQPYITIVFFPVFVGTVISVIIHKNFRHFLIRMLNIMICCSILLFSIIGWKKILISNGVDYANGRNSESFINGSILGSLSKFNVVKDNDYKMLLNDVYINDEIKEKLVDKNNKFWVIEVLDDNSQIIKKHIMFYKNEEPTTLELVKELTILGIKEPERVINSYIYNYLASIDVFISTRLVDGTYRPYNYYNYNYNHENESIGLSLFELEDNTKWLSEYHKNMIPKYISVNKTPQNINKLVDNIKNIYFLTFKVLYFILPYLFVKTIIDFIKIKKKDRINENYIFGLILIGFVFFHSVFHTVTGLIIDRYIYISFPCYIISLLILNRYKKEVK